MNSPHNTEHNMQSFTLLEHTHHILNYNKSYISALLPVVRLSCQSFGFRGLRRIHLQPYRNWETLVWAIRHAAQTPLDGTPGLRRSLLHPHQAEDVSLSSV
jgi:hypothetical protein